MTAEFYEGLDIFMTGGSGVVGKSAIEKLFRSCNVNKIYILLRCKKGVSAEDRLEEIKNSRIFKVLKEQKPNELDKLIVIPGDTSLDGLGISNEQREMLKNVSIFFHSAATTRFDEPLRTAIRINVKSTVEALKLAETFQNLKMFIHVSTFFSNPYLQFVENKVYPAVFDWKTALKMLDDDEIGPVADIITNKVINGFPNTYLFTKHLAEQVVNDYRFKLPVGIYRPSIVITALSEPEPGFTESSTGIMGLVLVWGLGLLQILLSRKDIQLDLTPLDSGTKVLLMFTARAAQLSREKIEEATPVTLFSSRGYVEYTMDEQCKFLARGMDNLPFQKAIWIPNLIMTSCSFMYMFFTFILQLLPALLIDGVLRLFGQKPFMMKIQRKIFVTSKVLHFFLNNEYKSNGVTNMAELVKIGNGTDFNVSDVLSACSTDENAAKTIQLMPYGCRKFLMNDDDCTLPRSRQFLKCKKIIYNLLRAYVLYVIGRCALRMAMEYFKE